MREMLRSSERNALVSGLGSACLGDPPVRGGEGPAKGSDAKARLLDLLVELLLSVDEPRLASGEDGR